MFGYIYMYIENRFRNSLRKVGHNSLLELIWTIFPTVILIFLSIPSIIFLYDIEGSFVDDLPFVTVKVIGNQWFWSYELTNEFHNIINYDSYMLDSTVSTLRLLETDNPLLLPVNSSIRFIITSVDVLHSFAVPSLGFKMDACPGRLNQVTCYINREGEFFGQCSELCGVNHGFTPIHTIAIK